MTTADYVLFLHILLVIVSLSIAAVLHTALVMLHGAHDAAEARAWPRVIERLEPLLPIGALLILATGGWLLHLSGGEFGWSDAWVTVSVVALFVVEALGAALRPRMRGLSHALGDAPAGPLNPDLVETIRDPALWGFAHFATAVFIGVIFLMVAKPSAITSVAVTVAAGAAGLLSALPFVSHPLQLPRHHPGHGPIAS